MIKNLLFDLGGVIMDLRRLNCVKAFEELGMANANSMLGEYSRMMGILGKPGASRRAAEKIVSLLKERD